MTDFVDPEVIAAINGAKDELIDEVAKVKPCVETICNYAGSLPNPIIPEAPIDGLVYGRKDGDWSEVISGGGSDTTWGDITGDLSSQTDLQQALDLKTNDSELSTVAKSGLYSDLVGKPAIIAEAPQDGKQYARIDAGWGVVEAGIPENPVLYGTTIMSPTSNFPEDDGVVFSIADINNTDSQFDMWKRAFSNTYSWRFRITDEGLFYANDSSGSVFSKVAFEGGGGNDNVTKIDPTMRGKLTLFKDVQEIDRVEVTQSGSEYDIETIFDIYAEEGWGGVINPCKFKVSQDGIFHKKGSDAYRELAFKDEIPEIPDTPSGGGLEIMEFNDGNVSKGNGSYGNGYVLGEAFTGFKNKRVLFHSGYKPNGETDSWNITVSGQALQDEGWSEGDECIIHFPVDMTELTSGALTTLYVHYTPFQSSPNQYSAAYNYKLKAWDWLEDNIAIKVVYTGSGRATVEMISNRDFT